MKFNLWQQLFGMSEGLKKRQEVENAFVGLAVKTVVKEHGALASKHPESKAAIDAATLAILKGIGANADKVRL